jgi:hypothetical protein
VSTTTRTTGQRERFLRRQDVSLATVCGGKMGPISPRTLGHVRYRMLMEFCFSCIGSMGSYYILSHVRRINSICLVQTAADTGASTYADGLGQHVHLVYSIGVVVGGCDNISEQIPLVQVLPMQSALLSHRCPFACRSARHVPPRQAPD